MFMVCVDKAPTSSEYKLLQLRQYLSEEAIRVTESLGHSTTAYQATKGRLERKYGVREDKLHYVCKNVIDFNQSEEDTQRI